MIDVPAVSVPHPGASYNPPVQVHEELLMEAYKVGQRRQEEVDRLLEARKKIEEARTFATDDVMEGVPTGMVIDEIEDDEETTINAPAVVPKKPPAKKTKQQRARMAKQRAEVRVGNVLLCVMADDHRNTHWPRKRYENASSTRSIRSSHSALISPSSRMPNNKLGSHDSFRFG